ncbi:MAG: sodium-dependent transporter [Balneolaceae bacterium]|nr:sodium-dependent transporter [Balneolaceae bacterium]MCH8548345.1 sodium-dependent transporter [Balneolaceae bacterium]
MATTPTNNRGTWNSKLGFILAAAGSAVGLGNIWGFPTQVADNGGAAFILIYLFCCLVVGFPVMVAELTIGRRTQKNPVGAFKALSNGNPFASIIGYWGVLCGVMILSFYIVISGWTLAFVFEEILFFLGYESMAQTIGDLGNGPKNALFTVGFMILTVLIVTGGVSQGIERATKTLMPVLLVILAILIAYIFTLDGAMEGLQMYIMPDFSTISGGLVLSALGQAFFSLSLGMGALITYGSYLNKKQNIVESAAYVTIFDIGIAVLAGLLVIPAMFVAQASGVQIFNPETGALFSSVTLVFDVLPEMFHNVGGLIGMLLGVTFFILLGLAALTSSISLLEVPVSYVIDEHKVRRKKAAWLIGGIVGLIGVIVSFELALIDIFVAIFNEIGLPLGGLMICIFLGYFWKTENALIEMEDGYENVRQSKFAPIWSIFIRYISPLLIALVLISVIWDLLQGLL